MSYQKQNFADGDVLTAAQLNHIEDGIAAVEYNANTSLADKATKAELQAETTRAKAAEKANATAISSAIDPTLSLSGKAADAKATGDALAQRYTKAQADAKFGTGTPHTLPAATASTLGGVKVGGGLTVTKDGTLSVTSVNGFSIKAQTTDPGTGSALSAGTILLVYK